MEDALSLARSLFKSQNISTFIFEPPYDGLERFDGGLRARFFPGEDYGAIARWILGSGSRLPQCRAGSIYLHEDFLRLCTVILPLPDGLPAASPAAGQPAGAAGAAEAAGSIGVGSRFFVAAPFLFERPTEQEVQEILAQAAGREGEAALQDFYRELPSAGLARDRFQSLLGALFSSLLGTEAGPSPLTFVYHYFSKTRSYLYTTEEIDSVAEEDVQKVEERYRIEHAMHEAVGIGDEQKAIGLYKQMTQTGIKPRTPNSVRNIKNFLIVLNSHLRKIMEAQGVHPYYVDSVSRNFAIQIEECTTNAQLSELSSVMIKSYCQHIREHRVNGYSEPVRKCALYIDFHYSEYLSLSVIARALNVNASYLSSQFKKMTGSTVTEYINSTRIKHALPLLAQSNRSIEDIAASCGFDDMNYFARVFKKVQGISPSAYRKQ